MFIKISEIAYYTQLILAVCKSGSAHFLKYEEFGISKEIWDLRTKLGYFKLLQTGTRFALLSFPEFL